MAAKKLGPLPDAYSIISDAAAIRDLARSVREDVENCGGDRVNVKSAGLLDIAKTLDVCALVIDRLCQALEEGDKSLQVTLL